MIVLDLKYDSSWRLLEINAINSMVQDRCVGVATQGHCLSWFAYLLRLDY